MKVTAILGIPSSKQWIRDNFVKDSYKIYIVFDNGKEAEMNVVNPTLGDRCALYDYPISSSAKVSGFKLVNPSGESSKFLKMDTPYQFTKRHTTTTFEVTNEDKVVAH